MAAKDRYGEIALLVFLSFLWGGSFTLIKIALPTVPPATIVLVRLAIGAAFLLAFVRVRGIALPRAPRLWGMFAVQGILQSALPFMLISWGELHIDSGLAGLLTATPPIFVFLIAHFVLREREAWAREVVGVVTGLAGVLVILGPAIGAAAGSSILGQLAVTGSSLSYALAAIYARRFGHLPAPLTAAAAMTMATLEMLPVALFVDRPWTLSPAPEALLALAALGVFSTGLAMIVFFRLVKTLGALGVSSGSYLRAGFGVLLGAVVLGEAFTVTLFAGLVLIFLGVAVTTGALAWPARVTPPK
ncbi:DMT family transporter [Afifella sp. IM 167]|uniref:DMT family transporter n=1 Tax=Afifella sp. IM 167 TaxID=2033586 RepID=UPI001CCEB617|nr:DMT family transporter [Afifella sp. IM 167]MBZ8133706.1 EamA family transporter [Afifella sp. IM 167]